MGNSKNHQSSSLPTIPDKRYFTIGEVSQLCDVRAHVLRYWEQVFVQLNPSKRRGNRRYYRQQDVLMVRKIRSLLYEQGFTISGAGLQLSGKRPMMSAQPDSVDSAASTGQNGSDNAALEVSKLNEASRHIKHVIKEIEEEIETVLELLED